MFIMYRNFVQHEFKKSSAYLKKMFSVSLNNVHPILRKCSMCILNSLSKNCSQYKKSIQFSKLVHFLVFEKHSSHLKEKEYSKFAYDIRNICSHI